MSCSRVILRVNLQIIGLCHPSIARRGVIQWDISMSYGFTSTPIPFKILKQNCDVSKAFSCGPSSGMPTSLTITILLDLIDGR